ncbi:LPD23 domain-containing protein [Campylobacter sp.]|uniref:putative barnase/colicin E5 family endoribonuclease n=1 Tax=Campylobacter sp. TaxID=205 RepID=UPI0038B3DF0A
MPFKSVDEIIDAYTDTIKNYDLRVLSGENSVIYAKEINGHHVAIEEALTGQDKMRFVTAWQTKGKLNKEILFKNARTTPKAEQKAPLEVAAQKERLSQNSAGDTHNNTLASGANSTTTANKSQAGNLEPVLNESKKAFDILKIDKNISDQQASALLKDIQNKNLKVNLPLRDDEPLGKALQKRELGYYQKNLLEQALNQQFLKKHQDFIKTAEKTQSKAEFQKFLKENKAEVVEYIKDMVTNTLRYIDAYGGGYHFTNTSSLKRANEMILNLESGKNFYFYNNAANKTTSLAPKSHYADELVKGNEAIQGTYKLSDEIKQDLIKSLKEFVSSKQNLAQNIGDIKSKLSYKIKEQESLAPSILESGKKANNGYDENLLENLKNELYLLDRFEQKILKNPQKTSSDLELAKNYNSYYNSFGDAYIKDALNEIKQTRQILEQELNIRPIKEFGTNYAEFYHDGANAIKKLLAERQGQVAGAFYKDGLGDIDVVWGNKEIGLNKIIQKHSADFESFGGVQKGLDEIITNGKNINENGVDTIWYKKGDDYYAIGLSKGYKNKGDNNWIITAYEKKNLSDNQKLRIDRFLNGGDSKTLSAYAEIKSSKTPELTTSKNSSVNELKSQENIKSTSKMPEISAGSKIKNEIFKNFMADEGVVQAAIVNDFENFKLFAKNKLDDLLVDAYQKSPDETRKLFDNVIGEFEPALNEFHKIAQSGELGAAKKTITQKQDLGKWELDKKALWHFESTLNTSAGGIKKEYTDDLAKIDELNLGDEVKFKLKEKYEKFLSAASDRVKKSKGGNVVFHHKKWGDATELEAFRAKLFNENSTPKELKSGGGFKKGFSTQAINQALLNVGSGVAGGNIAMANEDDPNKKAQAFIMGFLAGFGGSDGAMKLLSKNATKLAPQLARASHKLASELPRLFNDRPDILGGVLGRMNNAKDNFKNIFGGEKALGANKAKLKTAKDMAKNGADESQIWAKTGWYKDIDGKWKFEINAKGGELKELNAPELDEATKIIKRDYFDKQMNLKELEDFIQFKNGYIDFDAIKKFYDLPKDMSKSELTQKFPYFKMSVNDYMEHGFYKDIDLLHDEIMPARKILNQEYSKTPLNEVLDDPELFASYPQLKDVKVSVDELKSTEKAHFNPNKNEIVLSSGLDAQDMKSSLYHEIQHAVQKIEGFASGGEVGNLNYKKLVGEVEARNVQARLGTDGKEYLFKTMDIAANERIVKFDSDVSASYTPKQKEMRGVYNVLKNGKRSTQLYKDITSDLKAVDNIVKFEKGRKDYRTKDGYKNGFGLKHIQKHLDPRKDGYITEQELLNIGEFMRRGKMDYVVKNKNGEEIIKCVYESFDDDGTRFRVIIGENEKGDTTISFFSNRKSRTGFTHNAEDYSFNLNDKGNSTPNEIKSQELAMRESFSPELKASYEMRDKLLKSANEARAKLSQKGKDELDKLKDSKDSKLSRDAQIMKTLENAKSNPARYEKLKKLYLDENGKVKDSIGLC